MELKIDPELKAYLPPLDGQTKSLLEQSLIQSGGPRQPIEVWGDDKIIVDGHHRYEICTRLNLPFEIKELDFKSKSEVKQYMLDVQVSRRNLTKEQASQYRAAYLKTMKSRPGMSAVQATAEAAKDMNVSTATIKRDAQFSRGVEKLKKSNPTEAKKVETGTSKVNKKTMETLGKATNPTETQTAMDKVKAEAGRDHKKQPIETKDKSSTEEILMALSLFFQSTTKAGRTNFMDKLRSLMEIEDGKEYSMPPEFKEKALTKKPETHAANENLSGQFED